MTQLSPMQQPQPFEKYAPSRHETMVSGPANWHRSAIAQRDLIVVIGFCTVGLILTFAAITQLSAYSAAIGEISLIP